MPEIIDSNRAIPATARHRTRRPRSRSLGLGAAACARELLVPVCAALAALSVACGGGQTQGEAFDPRWKDDGGAGIAAFQQRFAGRRIPLGADVAVGVVAGAGAGALELVGVPLDGGPAWTFAHPLDARPAIAGSVVVGLGRGELFALDARTGELLWTRRAGGRLRGAGDDGETTVVSLVSTTGATSVVLAVSREGLVLRQIEDSAAIGVPAVVGRYAFLPWQGRYVTVFDLQTGGEVARALLRTEVSRAFLLGGAVFFGGEAATRFDASIGLGAAGRASTARLPARELPGAPVWMTAGTDVLAPTASAGDMARLYARPRPTGPPGIEAERFVATYYRAAVGLDARSGALAWAHAGEADFLGGAAYVGGFALCDAHGGISFLDAERGAVAGRASLGRPVQACVVQADGLTAASLGPRPVEAAWPGRVLPQGNGF
ncbi:outer membrane protein assembly factor BamB family protein [Sorangium sp. So ce381]|uniref:outer membrane protein assembly factor BamB family protein n=1 Tax=Sorangium sp. So ce381 TaxID=3133307 RepID=UPI003F5C89EF